MQPVVETLDGLERRIEVAVAMSNVEKQVKEELKKSRSHGQSARLPPGQGSDVDA